MYVPYDSDTLSVIIQVAKDYIGIIAPVAIGLFAVLLGVGYIPTIIKNFARGAGFTYWKDGVEYDVDGLMVGEWEDYFDENGNRRF